MLKELTNNELLEKGSQLIDDLVATLKDDDLIKFGKFIDIQIELLERGAI